MWLSRPCLPEPKNTICGQHHTGQESDDELTGWKIILMGKDQSEQRGASGYQRGNSEQSSRVPRQTFGRQAGQDEATEGKK